MARRRFGARFLIMNSVRIILVLTFFVGLFNDRDLVLAMSVLGFFVTFVPNILKKFLRVEVPVLSEVIIIMFVYGLLFLVDIRGFFADLWWWGGLLNFIAALALGLVGLSIMHVFYKEKIEGTSAFMIAFFAFCFAIAIGALWEMFEFFLDFSFGFILQKSATDTMNDLVFNAIGALVISVMGFLLIKKGKPVLVSGLIEGFVQRNPRIFKTAGEYTGERQVRHLIEKGEHKNLEFKSTLRKNLHTGASDKRIEHATLKTVAAYLNSDGGTLLVGVSNEGDILGLKDDYFESDDKAQLHFTNLIKQHIGSEFLPYIRHEIVKVEDNSVLKVKCQRSDKHVFLKRGEEEEFYVRNGPSSVKIEGSALIDYIRNNFGEF